MTDDGTNAGFQTFFGEARRQLWRWAWLGRQRLHRILEPERQARAAGAPVRIDISRLAEGETLAPYPLERRPIFVVAR